MVRYQSMDMECLLEIEKLTKHGLYFQKGAFVRGIPFELSVEEFETLVTKPCYYSNRERKLFNGIDRVDSNLGYIYSNCVPCDGQVNMAKGKLSRRQFAQLIVDCYPWASKYLIQNEHETEKNE